MHNFFTGLLYVFQSEHYSIGRFFRWAIRHGNPFAWLKMQKRKQLVWTKKAILLALLLTLGEFFLIALTFVSTRNVAWTLVSLLFVLFLTPYILIGLYCFFMWPLDFLAKKIYVARAKKYLRKFPNLQVVGITGSFGKTTMKEVVSSLLERKYKVFKTPENVNTLMGVAQCVLTKLQPEHEIFVVEMGAFEKGDIKALCEFVPPRVAILTGINEAHLEFFGILENTVKAKFEIVENMRPDGIAFLNGKNELVKNNAQSFVKNKKILFYGEAGEFEARNIKFCENFDEDLGWKFDVFQNSEQFLSTKTKILGSYIIDTIICGVMVAHFFDIPKDEVAKGLENLKPIPHRLSPLRTANDILIIDDAYNGNPDGAIEAMETLKRFKNRRKMYITPGLVELGKESEKIHEKLGKHLASCADFVFLIKNHVTPFLEKGLLEGRFSKENIVFFESTEEAHAKIGNFLKPNDVIVFQNDWPDQYF